MILSSICLCFPFILKCIYCLDQQNRDLRSKTEKSQFRKHPLKQSVCLSHTYTPKRKRRILAVRQESPFSISSVLFLLLFLLSFFFLSLFPEFIRCRCPVARIRFAFPTEMFYALRRLQICGSCSGLLYDLFDFLWILKHRTWTQMVVIKWLTVMICHEDRALHYL